MIKRQLSAIKQMANNAELKEEFEKITIEGVTTDSRNVRKGNLFVPIIGEKFNGHDFVEKAFENGAHASLWSRSVPNPPQDKPLIIVDDTLSALQQIASHYLLAVNPKVVGITGSNGKTTTKDMIASVVGTRYRVHKTKGNFNNHIGLPLTILDMPEDTEVAVLEMGMNAKGEIELLSSIARPDIAVITNIGDAHLQDLGSREGIAEAKLEIIKGLKENGTLIYHGDEPLLKKDYSCQTVTFGEKKNNNLFPTSMELLGEGTRFRANIAEQPFFIPVLGRHNVLNALAAIAVGELLKIGLDRIEKGLRDLKITNMRLELIQTKNGLSIINDAYNANPTAMKAAIDLVHGLKGYSQKILVLGDMLELGEREVELHQEVGMMLSDQEIDHLFTFGKLGKEIAVGAKKVIDERKIHVFFDKDELIHELKKAAGSKDLVLVKASRGMKLEDVVHALMEE